ncbi:MAG TPA: hypothetical protein PK095_21860, partial [Myxococcota bacterium]|nr:hypothetical protein [Myxococcota bacterium]
LGTIANGLRAADAWLQGGGDVDSELHGSRLTTEFPGAGTQGPAIKGHADRDINVDLIMAIANAKGMPGFNGLPKYSALTGKDLITAMFKDPEFGAEMLTRLVSLFDELSGLIPHLDPALAKKLEQHARTIEGELQVLASGFSQVNQTDGPEAKDKHPNEHYVKGLGWVPTVELVVEYGKTNHGGKVFEYVRWADHVTQYATDGALSSGPPPEAKGDPYFFVGGKTVRGFVSAEGGAMVYEDLAMPRPSWAKR